jgi:glycosyltransferase involved in cell wall biosynthesis
MRAVQVPLGVFVLCLFVSCLAQGATPTQPLVSVIVPTYQRSLFLNHALQLVRTQDYPNIEILVVDDSAEPSLTPATVVRLPLFPDFIPAYIIKQEQFGVRYFHLTERKTIGEKRNIAVSNALGEVIVHWDDDDFFRAHRISSQV